MAPALLYCSLVLHGLMAGFFYAFSVSVMPGLDVIESEAAIEAMQGINRAVRNPVFFVTFFLTPVISLCTALAFWRGGDRNAAKWLGCAGLLYIAGVIIPTSQVNVPMNDALALIDAGGFPEIWNDYSEKWVTYNHLRTLVATLCLVITGAAFTRMQPNPTGSHH